MKTTHTVCESALLDERYDTYRHKSGLRICLFKKKSVSANAALIVGAGSVDTTFSVGDETEYTTLPAGTAHFVEHKLFADENGGDALDAFAALNANANAYTTSETTTYLFSCTENFYESLALLLRFVTHPYFTEENTEKEKPIIAQEIDMYEDEPGDVLFRQGLAAMYREHPVKDPICGTRETLEAITLEVLYRFYHAFYQLSDMILTLEGDIDADRVLSVCDEILPDDPPVLPVRRRYPEESPEPYRKEAVSEMKTALPFAAVCYKDTEISSDPHERMVKCEAMGLLTDLLFSKTSHFYNVLYEEGIINARFSVDYEHSGKNSYIVILAETPEPEVFVKRVREYLAEMRKTHAITEEQFERCRRVMYAGNVTALESVGGPFPSDCANILLDGGEIFEQIGITMSLTREELFPVLDSVFAEEKSTVSFVYPLSDEEETESKI